MSDETTPALDLTTVFDVDAKKTAYCPLTVRFRGQEYVFGRTALGILQATTLDGASMEKVEGETDMDYSKRLLEKLPKLVALLCPGFPTDDWAMDEELALFQAVAEVLGRVGRVRFQA